MGRYRPPAPASSPYITEAGHRRLKQELDHLWRVRRPEVTRALSEAAAEGDRSENAEYIYRKKELREIDRRVRYLSKRLDVLRVVREKPRERDRIYFGARVEIEDETGDRRQFRIVGSDEIDPRQGDISIDSPMARAVLKKRVDDEIEVELPDGTRRFIIHTIRY